MEQYISKSALVAELEKRIKETESMQPKFDQFWAGQISAFKGVLKILDTLEVKEVDLKKAIDGLTAGWIEGEEYGELQNINTCRCVTLGEVKEAMRCMFELGLNAKVVWSEDI